MKKISIAALILLLLLVVHGVLRDRAEQQETEAIEAQQLVELDLDESERVTITRLHHEPARVVFEQRDGQWWLVEPIEYRADQTSLSGLVTQFGNKTYERSFESKNMSPFELDPARLTVTWETVSGSETIHIGKPTPVDNNLYARRNGTNDVMIVSAGFTYNLEKELVDYRAKEIFWSSPGLISAVSFATETDEWTLTKQDGSWYADGVSLDTGKVNPLLTRIENMRVRTFLDDVDATAPEFAVTRQIRLQGADGESTLEFAGPVEGQNTWRLRIAGRDDWVTISDHVYENLWQTPDDLRYDPPAPVTAVTDVVE